MLLATIAVIFISVALFLLLRRVLEGRREGELVADEAVEDALDSRRAPRDLATRVDRRFEGLIFHSGLGLSTSQVIWLFALTAAALAALLFFWSGVDWTAPLGAALGLVACLLVFSFLSA